jgi:hypothetical protein
VAGTYDTTLVPAVDGASEALGWVARREGGGLRLELRLDLYNYFQLELEPAAECGLAVRGELIEGGDILHEVRGRAVATAGGVAGALEVARFDPAHLCFNLERAAGGTPRIAAVYAFAFAAFGDAPAPRFTASVPIDVPTDGVGATGEALVRDEDGNVIWALKPGDCLVSPRGRLSCRAPVAGEHYQLALSGRIAPAAGVFYVGAPPSIVASGRWTATGPAMRQ